MSANAIIYFTPREATGVVSATYGTMRSIGGAIGPVIAGVFLSIFTVEIQDPLHAGEMLAIPDSTAFNITFFGWSLSFTFYDSDDDNHATTSDFNGYASK